MDTDPGRKYFVYLSRKLFQLEQKYGYKASKASRTNQEVTWRMKKDDCEIYWMVEVIETYGVPTIVFRPPNRNEAFGLHEAILALDPEHHAAQPKDVSSSMSRKQIRALMMHWAEFFHAHAKELLEDQTKTFKAVKNFRKNNPDPYP